MLAIFSSEYRLPSPPLPLVFQLLLLCSALLFFVAGCDKNGTPTIERATALSVKPDSVKLAKGDSVQMRAIPQDSRGDTISGYKITWASKEDTIATVDTGGTVVAQNAGSTTVTATAEKEGAESLAGHSKVTVDRSPVASLEVSASTSGQDVDSDGFRVVVDDSTSKDLGPDGSVTFSGLSEGDHSVELSGIAPNCSVEGQNPRTVTVEAGSAASASFSVSCEAKTGSLEVNASTSGQDQDPDGYTVTVDGSTSESIDPNASVTFADLSSGEHEVELSDIHSNCSVTGENPQTVNVQRGAMASVTFDVTCEPKTGSLEVSASTSGEDTDSDGYRVVVDDSTSQDIGPDGSVTFAGLSESDHLLELSGVKPNCSVDGQNPRTVTVEAENTVSTTFSVSCEASFGFRNAVLWEYEEWSLENPSYRGNPFDVIATVTFTHQGSGKTHETEMFYDGNDTWKFRFTGTRTGTWTFVTSSEDSELDGHNGTVDVISSSDSEPRGFWKTSGNKFAVQVSENSTKGALFLPYADYSYVQDQFGCSMSIDHVQMECWTEDLIRTYADRIVSEFGMTHIWLNVNNEIFQEGALGHDEHSKVNPGLAEIKKMENAILWARDEGANVHFWMWGDESRNWTPIGLEGGINGTVDRRLQRYLAARLGPLPGWTMSYGFDLNEWVSPSEVNEWAALMKENMGWNHILMARDQGGQTYNGRDLDVQSLGGGGPSSYSDVLDEKLNSKPYVEEERFLFERNMNLYYNMGNTINVLWWMAMAEGQGGLWGTLWNGGNEYSKPDWLATYGKFWESRLLLDMEVDNTITGGRGMRTPNHTHFVFFKRNTDSIEIDLSNMRGERSAIAVDTRAQYEEIDLGTLDPTSQTITLPHSSVWVIAVGPF